MTEPVVTAAPVKASVDTLKVVHYSCMSRQSHKIRTLTDTMPMSVDKIVEGEEGNTLSSNNNNIPTAAQIFAAFPQDKKMSYKVVADLFYVFFALAKNEWLCGDDYLGA